MEAIGATLWRIIRLERDKTRHNEPRSKHNQRYIRDELARSWTMRVIVARSEIISAYFPSEFYFPSLSPSLFSQFVRYVWSDRPSSGRIDCSSRPVIRFTLSEDIAIDKAKRGLERNEKTKH